MTIRDELVAAPRVPLRYLVRMNPRPQALNASESCYLPMEAISEFGSVDSSRLRPTSEVAQGYSYIADGDVAYAKVTPCFENGKGLRAADLPGGYAFATTEITVMRPSKDLDSRYLAWLLQSEDFRAPGESRMSGAGGLKRVPDAYAASFRIPHPRLEVQRAIADYLDRETAQIDAFIAKNEELIALLTERRLGLITRAAFRGLDPSASMRDSGTEWLGEVPTHWEVSRLSRWFDVVLGKMLDASKFASIEGQSLPYVRAANVKQGRLDLSDVKSMPFTAGEQVKLDLRRGDLVVVEGGASYGVSAPVPEDMTGWGFQKTVNRVRSRGGHSTKFLGYQLEVLRHAGVLGMLADASTIPHLTAEKLERLSVAMPPISEQSDVVEYVEQRTRSIQSAAEAAERSVVLARERRAALISAAVTGKIDVGVMT